MPVKFRTRTRPPDLNKFLSTLPRAARGIAAEASAEYIIGNERRGLKHYPNYKYITRKRAYGKTFSSDKQRKYVMARIRQGKITPGKANRTYAIRNAWRTKGKGAKVTIVNDANGVKYVFGDSQGRAQANQIRLVGWRTMVQVAKDNVKGAIRAADRAVQNYINSKT